MTIFKKISELPESSEKGFTIITVNNLSKKFDLEKLGDKFQFAAMPNASENQGKIFQYIGESNQNFVSGMFYLSESDGENWSWVKVAQGIDNVTLGQGIGTCSTNSSTSGDTMEVTMEGYQLVTGGIVVVKFNYEVPANAKLNINGQGAKDIYCRYTHSGWSTLPKGRIKSSSTATFIYDGNNYFLFTDETIALANSEGVNSIVFANNPYNNTKATGKNAVVLGEYLGTSSGNDILIVAVGNGNSVNGDNSAIIAAGSGNTVNGDKSVVIANEAAVTIPTGKKGILATGGRSGTLNKDNTLYLGDFDNKYGETIDDNGWKTRYGDEITSGGAKFRGQFDINGNLSVLGNFMARLDMSAIENQYAYGVEWDELNSSPTLTRVGNPELHATLPIQSAMKVVTLDTNGNETNVNWSNPVLDGSIGQVMVKIPEHWQKTYTYGTKKRIMWSSVPLPGYDYIPTLYVGSYQAAIERSTNRLMSCVNYAADYRGGDNSATLQGFDNTYRSLLGRPSSNVSRTNYRTYARNNGSSHWNVYTYLCWKQVFWAFAIEYATFNSQLAYNSALDANGYHQGGLGPGVSEWTQAALSAFYGGDGSNMRYPFVPCGHTDSIGNGTGVVDYLVKNASNETIHTAKVPRYRGIENPFGHIWQWIDGINIRVTPSSENISYSYVADSPAVFSDSNYEGYDYVGNLARGSNYGKTILFGKGAEILFGSTQSSATSYLCDYLYNNIPTATSLRGLYVGGNANFGTSCGLACAIASYAPSNVYSLLGSRLCYL